MRHFCDFNQLFLFKNPLKMGRVSIVKIKKDNLYAGIVEAVKLAGGVNVRDKRVLIKPNLVEPRSPESGQITSPEVIGCLIRYCFEEGARRVIVGDGPSYYQSEKSLRECFTKTGISKVVERMKAKWVVFDDHSYRNFENFSRYTPSQFKISEFAFSEDIFINVAVMKTHFMATVTLTMKNLKGCLKREDKPKFHRNLAAAVVDLNKIISPPLNIIDATKIKKGPPLIIAGEKTLEVDAVTSSIMGFSPGEIEMLKIGFKEGLGEINPGKIEILGQNLQGVQMHFEAPSREIKEKFPALEIMAENACCGCMIPLISLLYEFKEKNKMQKYASLKIIAGEKERKIKNQRSEDILFVGDCTRKIARRNFVEGCPPDKEALRKALERFFL